MKMKLRKRKTNFKLMYWRRKKNHLILKYS